MGNTRSATYSYENQHHQQQQPYFAPGQHVYRLGQPSHAVLYHSQYWNEPVSSTTDSTDSTGSYFQRDEAPEASPAPFVRHRNAPIRLPRINNGKDCWQGSLGHLQQHNSSYWQYSLLRRTRHKSLSCSIVHRNDHQPPPAVSLPHPRNDPVQVENERPIIRGAVSCASLNRRSPFRRQCFATRSYQQQRRLLACPVRPSSSLTVLTDAEDAELHSKARSYLEMARLKKQSVEQSLSQENGATNKSWISISQGSLDDEEVDAFTETVVGETASLNSDASYLTLMTAHTSLSSGYHGPASCATTDEDRDESGSQWFNASGNEQENDGQRASGAFYLEWLRQVSGSLPAYVELRQGRLHLKLTQGQCLDIGTVASLRRSSKCEATFSPFFFYCALAVFISASSHCASC